MDFWQQELTRKLTKQVNSRITEAAEKQARQSDGQQKVYYAPLHKWLSLGFFQ